MLIFWTGILSEGLNDPLSKQQQQQQQNRIGQTGETGGQNIQVANIHPQPFLKEGKKVLSFIFSLPRIALHHKC